MSSIVPSTTAPFSGVSYQAEVSEKPPVPIVPIPLNLNELFQQLVNTGMVPNPEKKEKKKQQIISANFDKPESLKMSV